MKTKNKEYVKNLYETLTWCTCGQGCHLCSGTIKGYASMYGYYKYWREYPDFEG